MKKYSLLFKLITMVFCHFGIHYFYWRVIHGDEGFLISINKYRIIYRCPYCNESVRQDKFLRFVGNNAGNIQN